MIFKTLRKVSTGEFLHAYERYPDWFTGTMPNLMNPDASLEDVKEYYEGFPFGDVELVELEIKVIGDEPN